MKKLLLGTATAVVLATAPATAQVGPFVTPSQPANDYRYAQTDYWLADSQPCKNSIVVQELSDLNDRIADMQKFLASVEDVIDDPYSGDLRINKLREDYRYGQGTWKQWLSKMQQWQKELEAMKECPPPATPATTPSQPPEQQPPIQGNGPQLPQVDQPQGDVPPAPKNPDPPKGPCRTPADDQAIQELNQRIQSDQAELDKFPGYKQQSEKYLQTLKNELLQIYLANNGIDPHTGLPYELPNYFQHDVQEQIDDLKGKIQSQEWYINQFLPSRTEEYENAIKDAKQKLETEGKPYCPPPSDGTGLYSPGTDGTESQMARSTPADAENTVIVATPLVPWWFSSVTHPDASDHFFDNKPDSDEGPPALSDTKTANQPDSKTDSDETAQRTDQKSQPTERQSDSKPNSNAEKSDAKPNGNNEKSDSKSTGNTEKSDAKSTGNSEHSSAKSARTIERANAKSEDRSEHGTRTVAHEKREVSHQVAHTTEARHLSGVHEGGMREAEKHMGGTHAGGLGGLGGIHPGGLGGLHLGGFSGIHLGGFGRL